MMKFKQRKLIVNRPCRGPGGRWLKPGDPLVTHRLAAAAYVARGEAREVKVPVLDKEVQRESPPELGSAGSAQEAPTQGPPYQCPHCDHDPYKVLWRLESHIKAKHGG